MPRKQFRANAPLIRPMLIVCPSCATSYDIQPVDLLPRGRQVRCPRCRTVWNAELSHADKLLAAAAAIDPDRGATAEAANPVAVEQVSAETATRSLPSDRSATAALNDEQPEAPSLAVAINEVSGPLSAAAAEKDASGAPDSAAPVEGPPIAPVALDEDDAALAIDADHFPVSAAAPATDIETVAARRQRRSAKRRGLPTWVLSWPLSRLQTGILALVLVDAVLIGWRSDVVRALPQTASFYAFLGMPVNLRGLAFEGVGTTTEQHEGAPILVVDGNVVSHTHKAADVPRLKFIMRNASRQEIYSWTVVPSRSVLPAGEAVSFRTRLAAPPPDARDLVLRFVTRRDIIGGTH